MTYLGIVLHDNNVHVMILYFGYSSDNGVLDASRLVQNSPYKQDVHF